MNAAFGFRPDAFFFAPLVFTLPALFVAAFFFVPFALFALDLAFAISSPLKEAIASHERSVLVQQIFDVERRAST
jgi:hypothetical protein